MNGFVIGDVRTGACVYALILQPNLGVCGISAALDEASAASTLAAMAFGILLNAAALSPSPMAADTPTDAGASSATAAAAPGRTAHGVTAAAEDLDATCQRFAKKVAAAPGAADGGADQTMNAAILRGVDTSSGRLSFFAHSVFPVFCVASSTAQCALVTALCERLCKAFCAHCGCDYVARTSNPPTTATAGTSGGRGGGGPVKAYKKLMGPVVKRLYGAAIRKHLGALVGEGMSAAAGGDSQALSGLGLGLFLLLSADGKKIVRGVACRPAASSFSQRSPSKHAGAGPIFSDPDTSDGSIRVDEPLLPHHRPAVSSSKLTRREVALVQPLILAPKPAGVTWWVTGEESGRAVLCCRDAQSRAFVVIATHAPGAGGGGGGPSSDVAASPQAPPGGAEQPHHRPLLLRLATVATTVSAQLPSIEAMLALLNANAIVIT
jgi:hypothetical protein